MKISDITGMAHHFAEKHLAPGDCAIDATVGNGKDLRFLAAAVGPTGKVYGFDIQPEALTRSRTELEQEIQEGRVVLIEDSHANLAEHILPADRKRLSVILFNLGYLPGGDPAITTRCETTRAALTASGDLLTPGGLLCVVAYPGHPEGEKEAAAVQSWSENLPAHQYTCAQYRLTNRSPESPWILLVTKA